MALGQRQVVDLLAEVSYHTVEPVFNQTLASPIGPGSNLTITLNPSSPIPATEYLYAGALIVVGWHGADAEQVTVQSVTGNNTFVASLVNAHVAGESVFGATFPTQVPTDPVWTQAEVIGYIAQAQNEFLTKVPLIFELWPPETILLGQVYQTVPNTAIEMERVSLNNPANNIDFAIGSITRLNGTVTAVIPTSTSSDTWTPGLPILVLGVSNNTFNSVSNYVTFPLETVSPDGTTLTWAQTGSNTTSSGGFVERPVWTRLYEGSQMQIAMQNPQAFGNMGIPQKWFEDRAGIYGWGVSPVPNAGYFVELLTSIRGSESLGLLDYFLVPDVFVMYLKFKTLQFCWTKDGVQASPSLARYAGARFDFGVMLADRYLRNVVMKVGGNG
jgi:hypothetical protein